jgi:uncharacterized protein YbjT (DUF2867 family)
MYVITGATGNTGSVVARRLVEKGKQVRAIGRKAERLGLIRGAEPFIADLTDTENLTRAFAGAEAVYAIIPPDLTSSDYRGGQERVSDSLAAALERARVPYVVSLSSVGADKASGTGPVVGLHNMEEKFNAIAGLNTLHLRPAYFMENTFAQISIVRATGSAIGPLRADLKLPMIAAGDIGSVAADELLRLAFRGHNTRELLGPRDYSMTEMASIIGRAIGKPELKYLQSSDEQLRPAMVQMGMTPDMVNLILEMSASINSGHMANLEPRSAYNTTSTTYEAFVAEAFVPAYRAQERAV